MNTKSVTAKKCVKLYNDKASVFCYKGKQRPLTDFECNKRILETFFVSSGRVFSIDSFSPNQGYPNNEDFQARYIRTTCSSAGARFNGMRYAMFAKPANHNSTVKNLIALLSPFSFSD